MSRGLCTLAVVALAAPLLARAEASAPLRVAVYGFPVGRPTSVEGALNEDAAFAATRLDVTQLTDGVLGNFDCLVARLASVPPLVPGDEPTSEPPEAFQAIRRFVARGGCYVGDWWGAGATLTTITPGGWDPPDEALGFFQGEVDGAPISTGTEVHFTQSHPITAGLPVPFNAGSGSEFFTRPIEPLDPRLLVIATAEGFHGTQPALAVGSTGRANAVLILFDAGDATNYWYVRQLFRNAVRWAATAPVDADAPVTSYALAGTQGKNGWYVSDVTVTLTASDAYGSGVASTEYALDGGTWQAYAGPFTISSEGTTLVSWRSTDFAGNVEVTRTLELRVDEDRPAIALAAPVAGASYALREPALASWSATDAVSGPVSTTATARSGDPLDTLSVGGKPFSIAAEDRAGNTAVVDASYAVHYVFGGWLKPLVADGSGVHRLQGNIPVKFQLLDWSGLPVATAVARLRVVKFTSDVVGTTEVDPVDAGEPSVDDLFQWDAASQAYVYKLSPKKAGLTVGTWELQAVLDDGTTYKLTLGLR